MNTEEKLQKDMITAMKQKDVLRLEVIRMAKTMIKLAEIEKLTILSEDEVQAILSRMVKQRKDSIVQFTAGGRSELADKEAEEIKILNEYMPVEIGHNSLKGMITGIAYDETEKVGRKLTQKDMGSIMKTIKEQLQVNGFRADGKLVSDLVKEALA
jgi:uncharacterized protein YqeY